MIAAVTGGRHLVVHDRLAWAFTEALRLRAGIRVIRHGGCTGADAWVHETVMRWGTLFVEEWRAEAFGAWPGCGPIRNRAMLEGDPWPGGLAQPRGQVQVLFAFPGGRGTASCVAIAERLRIPVVLLERGPW